MEKSSGREENYLARLVRRVQRQESDAFAELYALTYEKQYIFARKYLRDEEAAQDVLQEVYILVFRDIGSLREPQYFQAWLRQITFRLCYDAAAKRKKQYAELNESLLESVPDEKITFDPERNAEKLALQEILRQLPARERDAITMKYYAGMALKDIAQSMGCSVSSVTRYLQRGYSAIRAKLGERM